MRPTRQYMITLGPAVLPVEKGYEVLTDVTIHKCFGTSIKYVQGADMGFFQILNGLGDVIFTCPTSMILSVQASTEEYVLKTADVVPIRGTSPHLRLVETEYPDDAA